MYRATKKLRSEENGGTNELFLNDNLTSYNFSILMNLKRERKKMQEQNGKIFESVYSIDGKVFIKILKTNSNDSAIHVKTKKYGM